jgi:predicted RNA-binding protein with PIN domain
MRRPPPRGAAVTYLIDGYNLMHAIGLARRGLPAGALHLARKRLLDWLADSVKGRDVVVRVVFDGQGAVSASPEGDRRGVKVRFTSGRTADDEIEELLAAEARPDQLTVVSNDTRVREAGRRRGAGFQTCEEFIDWTLKSPSEGPPVRHEPEPDKAEPTATPDETAAWLAVFSRPKPKRRGR